MGMSELEDTATIKSLQLRTDVAAANADGSCLCLTGESNIMSGVAFDDVIFSYENIFYGSRKKKSSTSRQFSWELHFWKNQYILKLYQKILCFCEIQS